MFALSFSAPKNYGAAFVQDCPRCGNRSFFDLRELRRWLVIYIIPIPTGVERHLACRICTHGFEVRAKSHVKWAKQLNELTKGWETGTVSDADYVASISNERMRVDEPVDGLTQLIVKTTEALIAEHTAAPGFDLPSAHVPQDSESDGRFACLSCGSPVESGWSYCSRCGAGLNQEAVS